MDEQQTARSRCQGTLASQTSLQCVSGERIVIFYGRRTGIEVGLRDTKKLRSRRLMHRGTRRGYRALVKQPFPVSLQIGKQLGHSRWALPKGKQA